METLPAFSYTSQLLSEILSYLFLKQNIYTITQEPRIQIMM